MGSTFLMGLLEGSVMVELLSTSLVSFPLSVYYDFSICSSSGYPNIRILFRINLWILIVGCSSVLGFWPFHSTLFKCKRKRDTLWCQLCIWRSWNKRWNWAKLGIFTTLWCQLWNSLAFPNGCPPSNRAKHGVPYPESSNGIHRNTNEIWILF